MEKLCLIDRRFAQADGIIRGWFTNDGRLDSDQLGRGTLAGDTLELAGGHRLKVQERNVSAGQPPQRFVVHNGIELFLEMRENDAIRNLNYEVPPDPEEGEGA